MPTPTDLLSPDLAEAVANHSRGLEPVSASRALQVMGGTVDELQQALVRRTAEIGALLRTIAALTLPPGQIAGQIVVAGQTYLVWRGEDGEYAGARVYPHLDF